MFPMHSSLGIDYGTNSVRAVIVDCSNGAELGSSVVDYPSGHQGVLLDRNNHHLARQNPADYLYGLENCVRGAIEQAKKSGFSPETLVGIGVDTTGSSPMPVDAAMHDAFGGVNTSPDLSRLMKDLIAIKQRQNK